MELIPKELLKSIPELYATERSLNPICYIKLFTPDTQWTWFIIELDRKTNFCYGYVQGLDNELGYFSLDEIKEVKGPLGLKVERDLFFNPTALSLIRANSRKEA